MIWVVLLILAIIAAYYIYKGLRARHIARCQNDQRTLENVPGSVGKSDGRTISSERELNQTSNENANAAHQSIPAPQDGPSLLYKERTASDVADSTADATMDNQPSGTVTKTDPMDFTAETATLNSDEVGHPANSSDYQDTAQAQNSESEQQAGSSVSHDSIAPNTHLPDGEIGSVKPAHPSIKTAETDQSMPNSSSGVSTGAVAAGVAGIAGVAAAAAASRNDHFQTNPGSSSELHAQTGGMTVNAEQDTASSEHQTVSTHASDSPSYTSASGQGVSNDGIDLELGDRTSNEEQILHDEHDELLDFGDLTADISEMLKELNLRESDSPRLEINETEYQQLKTGEPGEVKPEKIENVAGKLRNMLQ